MGNAVVSFNAYREKIGIYIGPQLTIGFYRGAEATFGFKTGIYI